MDTNESEDEVPMDNTDTQRDIPEEESIEKRFFTIEVEFDIQNEVTNDEYSGMVLYTTQVLLQAWTNEHIIEDAYDLDGRLLENDYEVLNI
jgi:hypothetical protein